MPIPVHVICGKCGSLDIRIKYSKETGPYFKCNNCSEVTSGDTVNDWKDKMFVSKKKEE